MMEAQQISRASLNAKDLENLQFVQRIERLENDLKLKEIEASGFLDQQR